MSTNDLMLQMLEAKREAKQRYIEQKYKILSRQHDSNMTWIHTTMGLSSPLKTAVLLPAFQMSKICFDFKNVRLLLPTMFHEVISTLKTFFGRPDQILDSVIEKAK